MNEVESNLTFKTSVSRIYSVLPLLFVYIISTFSFILIINLNINSLFLIPIRVVAGFVALIVIPGYFLSELLLPVRARNVGTSIILGIILSIIEIQFAFYLTYLGIESLSLVFLMLLLNSTVVIIGVLRRYIRDDTSSLILVGVPRYVIIIMAIAFILRILMSIISTNSIAPDASLYSDFARNLLDGNFSSSIINDSAVISIDQGVNYIAHQGFAYITFLSFIITPPLLSGPSFILTIIGTIMIIPVSSITQQFQGENTSKWVSLIIALHPLYIYHSAVAYGPEICSLVVLLFAFSIMLNSETNLRSLVLAGFLICVVDVIWLPNYYIALLTLPLIIFRFDFIQPKKGLVLTVVLGMVFVSRVFGGNILIFLLMWSTALLTFYLVSRQKDSISTTQFFPLLLGIFLLNCFWQLPMNAIISLTDGSAPETDAILNAIFAPTSFEIILRFGFFMLFHLTFSITLLLLFSLVKNKDRRSFFLFLSIGFIGALGTFKVFGVFTKDTLTLMYLFSDSRFFLYFTFFFILAASTFFKNFDIHLESLTHIRRRTLSSETKKSILIILLIVIGFTPSIIGVYSGVSLIDMQS
ncbi:MAG: hypothetical protein ACTSWA_04245, partial [Candidatus Thorarchaeota archaeon]